MILRALRRAALLVGLLGLLFVLACAGREGVCLQGYAWEAGAGYVPGPGSCDEAPGILAAAGFFAVGTLGLLSGRSGRTREDAGRTLWGLLRLRGGRSLVILGVAVLGGALLWRLGWMPSGLPLPIAGFALFALVLRTVPPGSALDYDRAGLLWGGLALALSDGVMRLLVDGVRAAQGRERGAPWAETLELGGVDPEPAVREVAAREAATQLRGAFVALLGGLVVVEGVFAVNGLGETLKDLVVDRSGLDPLLLLGVLHAFGAALLAVDLLPVERLALRWSA